MSSLQTMAGVLQLLPHNNFFRTPVTAHDLQNFRILPALGVVTIPSRFGMSPFPSMPLVSNLPCMQEFADTARQLFASTTDLFKALGMPAATGRITIPLNNQVTFSSRVTAQRGHHGFFCNDATGRPVRDFVLTNSAPARPNKADGFHLMLTEYAPGVSLYCAAMVTMEAAAAPRIQYRQYQFAFDLSGMLAIHAHWQQIGVLPYSSQLDAAFCQTLLHSVAQQYGPQSYRFTTDNCAHSKLWESAAATLNCPLTAAPSHIVHVTPSTRSTPLCSAEFSPLHRLAILMTIPNTGLTDNRMPIIPALLPMMTVSTGAAQRQRQ